MPKPKVDPRLLDKEWRMSHLYFVTSKDGKKVKFVPNKAQRKLYEALKVHDRIINLKSRQLGISTGMIVWILDEILFHKNVSGLTIMNNQKNALDAFDGKAQFAWDNFNKRLRDALGWQLRAERANQLSFDFGDNTFSKYSVSVSGRSGTFQYVHISELGPLEADRPLDAKEIITGTLPAVPKKGKIVIESTAEDEIGFFASYWHGAVAGTNGFHPLFFSWRDDEEQIALEPDSSDLRRFPPEFQEIAEKHGLTPKELSYYHGKYLLLGHDWALLRQQYPTTPEEAFMTSVEKLFPTEIIDEYLESAEDGRKAGNTVVYVPPREGRTYVIGADVAEGVGRDSSTAVVFDVSGIKPKVVAEYVSDQVTPEDFAYLLDTLGRQYNKALVAVERNNHGHAVLAVLKQVYDEDLIYREETSVNVVDHENAKYGFHTTAASKPLIMHGLAQAVRENAVAIPSRALLQEMRSCPRAEPTKIRRVSDEHATRHFDLLMAASIGWYARGYALGRSTITTSTNSRVAEDPHSAL